MKGCCIECGRDAEACSNKGRIFLKDGTICCQDCFETIFQDIVDNIDEIEEMEPSDIKAEDIIEKMEPYKEEDKADTANGGEDGKHMQ